MRNDNRNERLQERSCDIHNPSAAGVATRFAVRRALDGGLDIEFYHAQANQLRAVTLYHGISVFLARVADTISSIQSWGTWVINIARRRQKLFSEMIDKDCAKPSTSYAVLPRIKLMDQLFHLK